MSVKNSPNKKTQTQVKANSFGILKTGGKQYIVKVGDSLKIEKITQAVDEQVNFLDILDGKKITAKVIEHGKGKKVTGRIFRNKSRSSRFPRGHRQSYTKIIIEKIS